jgi:CheY-like chemotaxis protein
MPEGGTIRISTSLGNGDDLPLAQRSKRGATAIVISVEDTGQGMDECALGHLFEPFFTTKEPGRGTGLGLAMVYSFVQLADGHIRVLSEPGRGSEFRLGFPQVTPDATIHSLIGQQSAPRSRSQQLVLVVQDDDDVRQHSAEIMRTLGYRVIEAHDSQAALSMLEKHLNDIALLFCDVGLANGASGHELAEQARLRQPLLKVLFTTGSADALADYQANGEPVIAKPFSTVQLALRMRETIDGSAAIAPRA